MSIKTGLTVPLSDLALHTLFDLLQYSAEIDERALGGKQTNRTPPMSIAEMTKTGRVRG